MRLECCRSNFDDRLIAGAMNASSQGTVRAKASGDLVPRGDREHSSARWPHLAPVSTERPGLGRDPSMETVVFRPYWNITPDLQRKEIEPAIARDPG